MARVVRRRAVADVAAVAVVVAVVAAFPMLLRRRVRVATQELRDRNAELEQRVSQRTTDLAMALADLEARNEEVVRFAQDVAHDLRGPIVAIGGLVGYLEDPSQPAEMRAQIAGRVQETAARLSRLIGERLDATVSRRQLPSPTGEELKRWLMAVIDPEAQLLGANLHLDLPDGVIDAPASALRQALLNLVGNSMKYGHGSRGLTVTVTLRRDDDHWELVVADEGPGVAPDLRDRVFDEGVRGATTEDAPAGLGLGLAATRRIVEAAEGTIALRDSAHGAVFVVRLPVVRPKPVAASAG